MTPDERSRRLDDHARRLHYTVAIVHTVYATLLRRLNVRELRIFPLSPLDWQ